MSSAFLCSLLVLALGIHGAFAQRAESAQQPVQTRQPTLRPDPARFAGEIAAFASQEPEKGGIVFTGSSSIRSWSALKNDFPGLPVVNRGFGGCVSNDMIVFFDTIVARHEPKLLVTYCGSNDIEEKLSVEEAFEDYTKFLTLAHERLPKTHVVLTSVKIAPRRAHQIPQVRELNQRLEAWCNGKDWLRFVDCTTYLANSADQPIPGYYVGDLLHLSPEGYAKWQAILEPVIREEWEKVKAR